MEPVRLEKTFKLGSSPSALWPLVSNTERLNRAIGLPAASPEPADPRDYSMRVRSRLLGLPVAWKEHPFDYVDSRYFAIERVFESGLLLRYEWEIRLAPDGDGAAATIKGAFAPRWPATAPLVRLAAAKALADMSGIIREIDASLVRIGSFPAPARTRTPVESTLFEARCAALRAAGADARAADRLAALLREGADDEVVGMRPYELADLWGLPRADGLKTCLLAVKAGLLDLSWEVLCPNCAAPKERLGALADLKNASHCGSCGIDYGVDLDSSVELRVSAHPSVRAAKRAVFCAGSPAHSRHARAQLRLDGSTPRAVELDLGARSYVVRHLQGKRAVVLRPSESGPASVSVDFAKAADGDELAFRPGTVRLLLQPTGLPALARVENEDWKQAAATAAHVTALQDFRDLFSSEVLAPGLEIGIKNLALLFTDLKGSTEMYERIGDATAYGIVRDHFAFLTAIVAARGGGVVKTIGDAVMAVFPSGSAALEAALDMQERVGELNARLAPRPAVSLKIGVHQGPAIAINSGGVLDYFGTMVNVSARVQNESAGGDIVITKAIGADPSCAAILKRREPSGEHFTIALKGLSGEFDLWRLRPKG